MSSTKAGFKRLLQEMFQFSPSDSESASKHDIVKSLDVHRMTETLCCDSEKCENKSNHVISNICLSKEKNIIDRIENELCDTAEISAILKYSSEVYSINRCMSSKNVNCCICNCNIMHCQKQKQVSNSYVCFNTCNLWRSQVYKHLLLPITKKVGTQWRNCFWRTFLIPFIVLLGTTLCNADPNQCAIGLKTPGSKFYKPI